jgi:hypothetical protein
MDEVQTFELGKYLDDTWVGDLSRWVHSKRNRKVKIEVDDYDVWSADFTLALIIYPVLCKFDRETFSCGVDDEDVPDHLKSTVLPSVDGSYDCDGNYFERAKWLLDELRWTFKALSSDDPDNSAEFITGKADLVWGDPDEDGNHELLAIDGDYKYDKEASKKHQDRINNGLRLFGRYYRGLWT